MVMVKMMTQWNVLVPAMRVRWSSGASKGALHELVLQAGAC